MYANFKQDDWPKWLATAAYTHNSKNHASTKLTPIEVASGNFPHVLDGAPPPSRYQVGLNPADRVGQRVGEDTSTQGGRQLGKYDYLDARDYIESRLQAFN